MGVTRKMSKRYKYGIFIASAILACAPLAMSNNVMGTNHVVKAAMGDSSSSNTNKAAESPVKTDSGNKDNGSLSGNKGSQPGNNGQSSGDKSGAPESNGEKNVTPGDTVGSAYQVQVNYDQNIATKIKATPGLTQHDVEDYLEKHSHVYFNGKEAINRSSEYASGTTSEEAENEKYGYEAQYVPEGHDSVVTIDELYDKDGRSVLRTNDEQIEDGDASVLLHDGDTIHAAAQADGLLPNKWYHWKLQDNQFGKGSVLANAKKQLNGDLPEEITDIVKEDPTTGEVTEKTDDHGVLPRIESDPNDDGIVTNIELGEDRFAPEIVFTISNDADAVVIPHDNTVVGKERNWLNAPVIDDANTTNVIYDDSNATVSFDPNNKHNSEATDNVTEDDGEGFDLETVSTDDVKDAIQEATESIANQDSEDNQTTDTTNIAKVSDTKSADEKAKEIADIDGLIFIHNAFIYDKNGKVVKNKDGAFKIKRVDQKAKILDGGRVYNINGAKFYHISGDKYVKVANIGRVSTKVQSVNRIGTIKASDKYAVKLYNSKGKFTKRVIRKTQRVSFDQRKYMHGHTYYRIKGTNDWVRVGSIKFAK